MSARFVPNPNLEQDLQRLVEAKLQPQVNTELRNVVRAVRNEMTGMPAPQVYDVMVVRLRLHFGPGFTPNEAELRRVAGEIEAGTLTG